jgi:photosystem II stability/assembly factor-like uncharacterized protein
LRNFSWSPLPFLPFSAATLREGKNELKNVSRMFLQVAACLALLFCGSARSSAQTWERRGPEGGDVLSLAAGPGGAVYLGTADGHVFASSFESPQSAPAWTLRGRAGARLDGVVQQLLVDQRNPNRLFAALWFQDPAAGGGVFRSDDGARTWTLAGLRGEAVRALVQSPSNPELLLAGTRTGIFRSNDTGANWQRISPAGDNELKNIDSLAIDPADSNTIYAGTYHLPWKTTDGGKTWLPIATGMIDDSDVMSLRIDAANPARLFASACSGIYRSENRAATWIKLQGIPYSSRRTLAILQDQRDPGVLYAGTTDGLWVTRDAGETWTRTTPREWVINAVAVVPAGAGTSQLLLGTESQGVLVSQDRGQHFSPANAGFSHRVAAGLLGDPRDPRRLLLHLAGPEDSLLETPDSGKTWPPLPAKIPSGGVRKLFATSAGWWASLNLGGLARYDDASSQWRRFRFLPPASPAGSRQPPAPARDPQVFDVQVMQSRIFIAAANGFWSGEIGQPVLRRSSPAAPAEALRSLDVLPGAGELWAVSAVSLFHSLDAGKTWTTKNWTSTSPGAATEALLWVRVVATPTGNTLFIATQDGVYQSALPAAEHWQLLQNGLPAAAAAMPLITKRFLVLPMKNGGVYLSRDSGKSWERLDGPGQESILTGLAEDGHGGFFAASQTDGVLHWEPGTAATP